MLKLSILLPYFAHRWVMDLQEGKMGALQKRTTEHTEYAERVRFMNNKDNFWSLGAL